MLYNRGGNMGYSIVIYWRIINNYEPTYSKVHTNEVEMPDFSNLWYEPRYLVYENNEIFDK